MNGRDFRQMIKLAPGVSPASTSVNGMRTSGNNYQIDGADNNDAFQNAAAVNQGGVSGIAGTLLPIEAIDQFSVQSNASAETGRNGGSSVNVVIKSGTNSLHGSAYYFNRNEALAARSPFQTRRQPQAGHPQQSVRLLARRADRAATRPFTSSTANRSSPSPTTPCWTRFLRTPGSPAGKSVLAQYGVAGQSGLAEPADHLARVHPHRRGRQQ